MSETPSSFALLTSSCKVGLPSEGLGPLGAAGAVGGALVGGAFVLAAAGGCCIGMVFACCGGMRMVCWSATVAALGLARPVGGGGAGGTRGGAGGAGGREAGGRCCDCVMATIEYNELLHLGLRSSLCQG